jgi:hypothetical protein
MVKDHELTIIEPGKLRELLGVRRLTANVINELSKELDKVGYVIISIRYSSARNGYTDVRKVIIIKKDTYIRIVKNKDRNAMARAIIDYVMSNKQLFEVNVKNRNGVLKIQTSVIRKLLRYIGVNEQYLINHMNSIVLSIRTLLEVSGFPTKLKRAMGRMGSVIYVYEGGRDGDPRVTEAGERFLNPPAETEAGGERDGIKSSLGSNPGSGEVHTGEKEDPNYEELEDTDTRLNGAVGTTSGIHRAMGREGGGNGYDKDENHKGGRTRTSEEARGGD